jgi:hypothetical protein
LQAEPIIARLAKANQVARKGDQSGSTLPNLAKLSTVDTRAEVAKQAGVSHGTYDSAKRVIDAVKSGARYIKHRGGLRLCDRYALQICKGGPLSITQIC